MSEAPVRVEREGDVAVLTLSNPPLNLFDRTVSRAFADAIGEVEADLPRAVLIRADGKVVSGGVDVHDFDALDGPAEAKELFDEYFGLTHRMEALPVPTVFAAHGLCLTAAFELSLACDLLLAAESAKFGLVEVVVGLTPAMGGTQRLAERAGPARARQFVYEGRPFSAAELERWNVVNIVAPDEGFDDFARDYARRLAAGPTKAHGATKRIVREQLSGGVARADSETPEIAAALFETEDLQAAVKSFLSEGPGKATYTGR
jgi:enoyl-CoA hydratase/carnithine racemase